MDKYVTYIDLYIVFMGQRKVVHSVFALVGRPAAKDDIYHTISM